MIKILIVDDSRLFRERIQAFLAASPEIVVVGEAEDGQEVLGKARELKPDVVLMDVKMGRVSGLTATGLLKRELPNIRVIILSLYDLEAYREAAETMGASAYVSKKHLVDELLPAIRRAVQTNQFAPAPTGLRRQTLVMSDEDKTKALLVNELKELRQRVAELEASQAEWMRVEQALRESERRYRLLAENATDVIWTMDLNLRSTYTSPSMKRLRGFEPEDAMAQSLQEALTPASFDTVLKIFEEELEMEKLPEMDPFRSRTLELEVIRKDGSTVWVESTMTFLRDSEGKPVEILGVSHDITRRRQAEETRRESEERYRSLFENMLNGLAYCRMIFDGERAEDFIYLAVNGAFQALTGLKDIIGKRVTEAIPGIRESNPELFEIYGRVALTGVPEVFETYVEALKMWFSISVYSPQKEYFVAVFDVITQRKLAEQTVRESQARLAGIIDSAMDAIISLDADQRIILYNGAAEQMFRCPAAKAIGQPLDRFIPELFREAHYDHIRKFGETNQTSRSMGTLTPLTCLRADGNEFPAEISISQIDMAGVRIYTAILRDVTERVRAQELIQRQLKRLNALRMIDIAISSSSDLHVVLAIVLQQALSQLEVDAGAVLLFNPQLQTIEYAARRGFRSPAIQHTKLRLGEGYAGRAVLERRTIHVPALMEAGGKLTAALQLAKEEFVDYYGTPLVAKGEIKGVLEIYHRSPLEADPEWLDFLEILAGQAAIALDNAQLFSNLQRSNMDLIHSYDATINGWSQAMDLRDRETEGHTLRVTDLTLKLSQAMGISEAELIHIRRGCLLHDIGKLGVPDNILFKPGKLTEAEWQIMRRHPTHAYEMLSKITYLRPALDIPYCHHEKWDGTGYPQGLKGEEIPVAARIFAIADVWDAITSDRPYRKGWSREQALEHIKEQSGKYFDPQVVAVFLRMIASEASEASE